MRSIGPYWATNKGLKIQVNETKKGQALQYSNDHLHCVKFPFLGKLFFQAKKNDNYVLLG